MSRRRSARRTSPTPRHHESARQAIDEFLTIAAHELKTPIVALQLQTRLLIAALGKRGPASEKRNVGGALRRIDQQSRRVMDLTTSLLEFARLVNGLVRLRADTLDFGDVLRDAVEALGPEAEESGCETRLEAAGPLHVTGDRATLEILVRNLLSNAYRYAARRPVTLVAAAKRGRMVLEVRDGGNGIAVEERSRIFQRFVRVARDAGPGGLGIGLYLVRRIARLHGGSIRVASAPGKGASFRLTLPLARGTRTPIRSTAPRVLHRPRRRSRPSLLRCSHRPNRRTR